MKIFILFALFVTISLDSVGQNYNWKWAKGASVSAVGSGSSITNSICHAKDSNFVYVGGQTSFQSLSVIGSLSDVLLGNGQDAFLAKYTSGGALSWVLTFGSGGTEEISAIDEDDLGNIIVGGSYTNGFSITGNDGISFSLPAPSGGGTADVFVVKFNYQGNVIWVQAGRSSGDDYIHDIEVYNNVIYISGDYSNNFSVGPLGSPTTINLQAQTDAFAWSILADGSLNWIRGAQSSGKDSYHSVTVMASGAYFGGYFSGSSLTFLGSAAPNSVNTASGIDEGLLVKYSLSGIYANHATVSGAGRARINGICNNGTDLFYTGYFNGATVFPNEPSVSSFNTESFVAKCDQVFSTTWKNFSYVSPSDSARGFAIDAAGTAYVANVSSFTGPSNLFFPFSSQGGQDILVAILNQSTGSAVSVRANGGPGNDLPNAISAKNVNEIYIGGNYGTSCNFNPQPDLTSSSIQNAFWAKYGCVGGTAVLSGTVSICQGDSTILNVAFTGGSPYTFSYTDGVISSTISGIMTNSYSFKVSPSNTTTYSLISAYTNACINSISGVATVSVIPQISNYGIISPTEICGSGGFVINASTPTGGGSGPFNFNWEYSADGGISFSSLGPPVTLEDNAYSGTYAQVYKFRRSVNTNTCLTKKYSDTVTVDAPILGNTITTPSQSICEGNALTILAQIPTNNGSFDYIWDESSDGINWILADGVNSTQNYSIISALNSKFYRRRVSSGACGYSTSNTIQISVDLLITSNTIKTKDSLICSSNQADTLFGSTINGGGTGIPQYQWFQKTALSPIWIIGTAPVSNQKNYLPGFLTSTTYFQRRVISGVCDTSYSNVDTIYVQNPITGNNIITPNQHICQVTTPSSIFATSVVGLSTPYSFTWQKKTFASPTWTNVAGSPNSFVTGILSESTMFIRKYRDSACGISVSDTHKIVVDLLNSNNSINGLNIYCYSANINLDGTAASGGAITGIEYEWQFSTDNLTFQNVIPSEENEDFLVNLLSTSKYFRRKVESGLCPSSFSDTVLIELPINNNTISSSQFICAADVIDSLIGPAPSNGTLLFDYLWEKSINGVLWDSIPTANDSSQNFLPASLTTSTYFRRKIETLACGISNSNSILISVQQPISNNTITAPIQPICSGNPADSILGSNPSNGNGAPYSYFWQQKTLSNANWQPANGINSTKSYSPGLLTETTIFRRIIPASSCDSSFSNMDTVYVQNPIANSSISSSDQFICSTNLPDTILATLPTGGNGINVYFWQNSNQSGPWVNSLGSTADSLNFYPGSLTQTTSFRRIIVNSVCGNDTTGVHIITVHNPILTNTLASDTTICYQSTPDSIIGTIVSNGLGYLWEQALDTTLAGNWTVIAGALGINFSPNSLSISTFYRRIAEGGFCMDDTSNIISISVGQALNFNIIANDTAVCFGLDSLLFVGSNLGGGIGSNSYQWQSSLDNISFQNAVGNYQQSNYLTGQLTVDMYYRRYAVNSSCASQDTISDTLFVEVYSQPTVFFDFDKDSICAGQNSSIPVTLSGDSPFSVYMNYGILPVNLIAIPGPNYNIEFLPSISNTLLIDSISDVHGCSQLVSEVFNLRVIDQPQTNFFDDTSLCDSTYFINPVLSIGTASVSSPSLAFSTSVFPVFYTTSIFGQHDFILTETNEICVDSDTMKVNFSRPIGDISAGLDQSISNLESVYMDATSIIGTEQAYWEIIGANGNVVSPYIPNSQILDIQTGTTYFVWTVTNGQCPIKRDTVAIQLLDLFIPTGFSPNGDGDNDVFFIRGTGIYGDIELQIFNRWGNKVFSSKKYQNDWDGKLASGEELPDDTYYYILDLSPNDMFKGYLVLKR